MPAADEQRAEDSRGHRHDLSRRTFLKGVAGAVALAGAAVAAGGLAGCDRSSVDTTGLMVSSSDLVTTDDLQEVSADDFVSNDVTVTLPAGTMAWAIDDSHALLMLLGSSARPLNILSVLSTADGSSTSVLEQGVGAEEGFDIYEARASDGVLLWTEVKYSTYDWRVYCASFRLGGSVGSPRQLDAGNSDYLPPLLCACGDQAVWTVVPDPSGPRATEGSVCKACGTGETSPRVIYQARGTIYAIPERSDDIVTITPRLDSSTVNYVLTAQRPGSGDIVAQTTLPRSVRPLDAIYMDGRFAFQIEASFDSSSAIAQMGTYYDVGDGRWLRVPRTPACTPALSGSWFISKASKGTVVVDVNGGRYFTIASPDYSTDYGDYLATSGSCKRFLVYSTVADASDATKTSVTLRGFSFK